MCSLRDFSRALYPLAVRRRAPRWLTFWPWPWPWPWPSSYGSGSPPAARPRRVSRSENRECIESASERARRVDHFCELRARARRSRGRRRPIFFLRIRLAAQRECSAAAPSAASYGVDVAAGGLHRQADGSRPCARSEISAVPFIRWRYGAERRAGLLFGLGLGLGRGRRATGQDRRRPLAPGGSRAPKIASALNLHPKGPARVDHFCELRARARRSRGRRRPIFFLRIRLAAQRECSAAAPSAASYGVDVAAGGLHRQADGSRPCARSEISAVPFIRWRYGAERRAGLLFGLGLGLGRGRRATGQDRRRPLAPGGSRAPKIASALNLHPKGPARVDHFCELRARARRSRGRRRPIFFLRIRLAARGGAAPSAASYGVDVAAGGLHRQADGPALITFVNYARARGGAEAAAGRFFLRNPAGGAGAAPTRELRGRRRRRRLAPAS